MTRALVVLSVLLSVACDMRPAEERPENINSETSNAGVVVHGYTSFGYIKNTNDFPVRVKRVWIFQGGETTDWVTAFQPGEDRILYVSHQHGFHIYDMTGAEIGWIKPFRNGDIR